MFKKILVALLLSVVSAAQAVEWRPVSIPSGLTSPKIEMDPGSLVPGADGSVKVTLRWTNTDFSALGYFVEDVLIDCNAWKITTDRVRVSAPDRIGSASEMQGFRAVKDCVAHTVTSGGLCADARISK